MNEAIIREKPSSIEVNRTSKGEYSFAVKLYFDQEHTAPKEVVDEIRRTHDYLNEQFLLEKKK